MTDQYKMSETIKEIAREKKWSDEDLLERLLVAIDELDATLTPEQSHQVIDFLEEN